FVPNAALIAVLFNPQSPDAEGQVREVEEAARKIGQPIHVLAASSAGEFDAAFGGVIERRAGALFVSADPLFTTQRARLVALAAPAPQPAIPATYPFRVFVLGGGVMSYGANLLDVHRQAGVYTGRILKDVKPADLPVLQPTKFDLVINLKTAKALGVKISDNLL